MARLASRVFERRRAAIDGDTERVARLELEIVDLGELIERRLELTALGGVVLPLDRLRQAFQLEATEQRCIWLLLGVALFEEVRALAGGVTLEILDEVVYTRAELRDRFARELGDDGRLARYRLIEIADGSSLLARGVRVTPRLVDLAYGIDRPSSDAARYSMLATQPATTLIVGDSTRELLRIALRRHVETGTGPIPVVRGVDGAGRRSLVADVARELGATALHVPCAELPAELHVSITAIQREAILHRAVIVLCGIDGLSDERQRALDVAFADYPGPVASTGMRACSGAAFALRGACFVDLAALGEAQRAVLWRRALGAAIEDATIAEVAARYRLTGGQIAQAARACNAANATLADLHAAVSSVLDNKLAVLGTRIEWRQRWEDLVLPDESYDEIVELIARIRYRKQVLDDWGFGERVAKGLGLTALFSGPPGTGKTMAAGLVAKELGLDLYQIDLSRMVSKYVGETEKNLAQVFDAAESGHAILLFDEADALFSKRTEVKSSVDRYANLEVNYLLQRLEAFQGIAILTTNFDHSLDDAFRRRLSIRIAFPLPECEERRRLWRALIPERALGPDVDFAELARRFEMSGGYIKNAAVRAAYLAAADGTRISMQHLLRAGGAEYASMGKVVSEGRTNAR